MSWPGWSGVPGAPQAAMSGTPMVNAVQNVAATLLPNAQYTAEQWAQMQQQNWQQWAQWQQQFQQWQQQYGAEYQKSLNALAQSTTPVVQQPSSMQFYNPGAPPLPVEIKPPPPPDDIQTAPPQPPPLLQGDASFAHPNVTSKPPPPPPTKETFGGSRPNINKPTQPEYLPFNPKDQPVINDNRFGNNVHHSQHFQNDRGSMNSNWQKPNQPHFDTNRPSIPPNDGGTKRPFNNHKDFDPKRSRMDGPGNWQGDVGFDKQQWKQPQLKPPEKVPPKINPEELSEAEKKFDKQFADWEAQFQKWKEQNANHPDKEQYREYEKKWETWRAQLLERREMMRRKRLGITGPITPSDKPSGKQEPLVSLNKNQPPIKNVEKDTKLPQPAAVQQPAPVEKPPLLATPETSSNTVSNKQPIESKIAASDVGFLSSSSSNMAIPGLDLAKDGDDDETEEKEEIPPKKPDLEVISRGINSILEDKKLMNILSMVSQNNQLTNLGNTVVQSSKPLLNETSQDGNSFGDYSNQESDYGFQNRNEFVSNIDEQTRSSFNFSNDQDNFDSDRRSSGPNYREPGPLFDDDRDYQQSNRNFDNFRQDNRNRRGPGNFDNFNNKNASNNLDRGFGNFNREQDNFRGSLRGPNNFDRNADKRSGFYENQFDDFNSGNENFNRGNDNFNRGTDNFNRGNDSFNRGNNSFNRGNDNFNRGNDNFNRGNDNFNRGSDNFNRSGNDSFNRGSDNYNRDLGEPDNFNRERNNFNRGLNNRGPDNFNRGDDSFNRGPDNFNKNLNPVPNNFNESDNFGGDGFNRGPDNFNRGSDNLNKVPNNFNKGPNNFNSNRNFERGNSESSSNKPFNNFNKQPGNFEDDGYNEDDVNNFDSNINSANKNFNLKGNNQGDIGSYNRQHSGNTAPNVMRQDMNLEGGVGYEEESSKFSQNSGSFKKDELLTNNVVNPTNISSNLQNDNECWKPEILTDYDHKSLKHDEGDISIEIVHMFDYRHKPLNRIPYPQRPAWLSRLIKNYPEFDLSISRPYDLNSRPYDLNRRYYTEREPLIAERYDRYEMRSRKLYDYRDRGSYPYESKSRLYEERNERRFDTKIEEEGSRRNYDKEEFNKYDDMDISSDKEDSYVPSDQKSFKYDDKKKSLEPNFEENKRKFFEQHKHLRPYKAESPEKKRFCSDKSKDKEYDMFHFSPPHGDNIQANKDFKSIKKETIAHTPPKKINNNVTLIEDLLSPPGRYNRPPRLVIILRGPSGSGKSFLAKLIKDREVECGGSAPRILCLDDYFMVEQEKEIEEDGRKIKTKEMVYEFEEGMETSYRQSLMKSFKKTITDGYFNFIVVDNVNDKVKFFGEMWSFAKQNGFQVYICQLELDVPTCVKRTIHGRSEDEIKGCVTGWEATPLHHPILDCTSLLQSASISEVEMEEINSPASDDNFNVEEQMFTSKWDNFDYSVDKLAKLDGTNKPLRHSRTMEEYLQLDDEWVQPVSTKPGQKRVRWADLEERKEQEKMRAIGFVVGQTNWDRMMDPTMGSGALTQTKYIERY